MIKISVSEDCGNAPKKQFIKDFCIASANGQIAAVIEMVTDDIALIIPGYKNAHGRAEVEELLTRDAARSKVSELIIDNILSHGDRCAANGTLRFEDGGVVAFCNVYRFNGHGKTAKIKEITTYSIEPKSLPGKW